MSIVQAFSISPPSLGSVGLRPSLNRLSLHHWALAILLIILGCKGPECLNIFAPTLKFALATGGRLRTVSGKVRRFFQMSIVQALWISPPSLGSVTARMFG